MTLEQTADYLHLHPVTVRNKARQGEIPAVKLGRQWRFVREQLEAWLRGTEDVPQGQQSGKNGEGLLALLRRQRARLEEVARQ